MRRGAPYSESRLGDGIASCLLELYTWHDANETLRARYYEGVSPLMSEPEQHLTWLVEQAELLAELFNDHLLMEEDGRTRTQERGARVSPPIDTASVRQDAQRSVEGLLRSLVAMARAEACEMMGERKQALAFAERYL